MAEKNSKKTATTDIKKWCHTGDAITKVYPSSTGGRPIAHLLMGEWVKPTGSVPGRGKRVEVYYRGGKGYIDPVALGERCLEMFFIDVGQGDSILIQTPEDRRILIDGGEDDAALRFIEDKYRLDKPNNFIDFDAVICTHMDKDHSGGAIHVLNHPKIAVRAFYHNGLFPHKNKNNKKKADLGPHDKKTVYGLIDNPCRESNLTDLMSKFAQALTKAEQRLPRLVLNKAAPQDFKKRLSNARKLEVKRLDASMGFVPGFGGAGSDFRIEIIWPKALKKDGDFFYHWYGDVGKTVNGNSVVLRVLYGRTALLLAGDINQKAMTDMLSRLGNRKIIADVYKAAHHGSQDFSMEFLKRVRPNAAVISSGDNKNDVYGHPRAVLMGSIVRNSRAKIPAVFCTELAACYQPLSKAQRSLFRSDKKGIQLYEKSIEGIVHFRCRSDKFYLGAVYNKTQIKSKPGKFNWKWDVWPDPGKQE